MGGAGPPRLPLVPDELAGEDIAITWEDARAANLANWNDRVPIHTGGGYDLESFRANPEHISQVVRTDLKALDPYLPNGVTGLDVCHLQCHIGTDTLSLARLGARVVGVDFETMRQEYLKKISLRRMVTVEDVAAMALFLCSPAARNVTGQAISVDGNVEYL